MKKTIHEPKVTDNPLYQAVTQYHLIATAHYTTVDGRCIAIMQTPLRKYRNVRIVDDQDHEITLVLPKQDKVEIGHQYRFYFKDSERIPIGSSILDTSLPADGFLGLEEIATLLNKKCYGGVVRFWRK